MSFFFSQVDNRPTTPDILRWTKPISDTLKCNVDAYVHLNACSSSFAVVVHDEFGIVLYGFSDFYPNIVSPLAAEAVALRETLRWLLSLNLLSVY